MTLRLHKVTKQIDRLRENAVTRAAQQRKDLPKVEKFFQRAAELDDLSQKARLAAEKEKWNGALPTLETIALQKAAPSLKSPPTLVAVDGSQIYPDPHEASLICAINIGYFILRPGTGEVVADSEPAIEVDEDALAPGGNLISKTVVDARRTVEEMTVLEGWPPPSATPARTAPYSRCRTEPSRCGSTKRRSRRSSATPCRKNTSARSTGWPPEPFPSRGTSRARDGFPFSP